MKCTTTALHLLTWLWLTSGGGGVTASFLHFRNSIHHEFKMGLVVPRQGAGTNLQAFAGALGGIPASEITDSGDPQRPFGVDGDTFPDFATAATRACDNQKNRCAEKANEQGGQFSVGECDRQQEQCKAVAQQAQAEVVTPTASAEATFFSSNAEFDFFCE